MGPNWDPLVSHMGKSTWAPCGPPGQNVVGPTWAAQVGPTWQPTRAPSGAHVAFLLGLLVNLLPTGAINGLHTLCDI